MNDTIPRKARVWFNRSVKGIFLHLKVGRQTLVQKDIPESVRLYLMADESGQVRYDEIRRTFITEIPGLLETPDYSVAYVYFRQVARDSATLDWSAKPRKGHFAATMILPFPKPKPKRRKARPGEINDIFSLAGWMGIGHSEAQWASAAEDMSPAMVDKHFANECERRIARSLFKYTSCGCTFNAYEDGVTVSGYVEGWDGELPSHRITYPFRYKAFEELVEKADQDGVAKWNETHGCEDCGPEDPFTGYRHVREGCESCGGDGQIL